MDTTGSGSKGKDTGAKSTAPTVAADTAAGAPAPDPKQMPTTAFEVVSPMSRAAKVAVVVVIAVIVLGAVTFMAYRMAPDSLKDDLATVQDSVTQYLAPVLTPTPAKQPAVAPVVTAKPDAKQMVSSTTAADYASHCRMLLKGLSTDFTSADLACVDSPEALEAFKDIVPKPSVDQVARFCNGIAAVEVSPAVKDPDVGMRCIRKMSVREFREMRPNERPPGVIVSSE